MQPCVKHLPLAMEREAKLPSQLQSVSNYMSRELCENAISVIEKLELLLFASIFTWYLI